MNNGILTQSAQPVAMPYGLLGRPTSVPMPFYVSSYDSDAADYIRRIEAADGQALELPVKQAIETFVRGCKSDGIWQAIKGSCILAGARTLSGALTPLAGVAPVSYNFVSADYSRKLGLLGDGSSKYIDSSISQSAQPLNSRHVSVFVGAAQTGSITTHLLIFAQDSNNIRTSLYFQAAATVGYSSSSGINISDTLSNVVNGVGFYGHSRSAGASYVSRVLGSATTIATASSASSASNYGVFGRLPAAGSLLGFAGRIAFYSIGEALDLALLDARVTTLMNTLAAVL